MKRVVVPELLDSDSGTPEQIEGSLADLRWLNRNFGGVSTTVNLIERAAARSDEKQISLLDVAGATGDIASAAKEELRAFGIQLETVVLDRSPKHLSGKGVSIAADAFHLPFHDRSFDVVGSALFLHHLEPEQIILFIRECLRVSRLACFANDLKRGYFHLLAAGAGRLLYKSPITKHDSVASVRRAYTKQELSALLKKANIDTFDISDHYFCRMGVIIWKERLGGSL